MEVVFYEAMRAGYATGVKPEDVPGLPGAKMIRFEQGGWRVDDVWYAPNHSSKSFGSITIFADGEPYWVFQFRGWYEQGVLPFLKLALGSEYKNPHVNTNSADPQFFTACRGPRYFKAKIDPSLCYVNLPDPLGTFSDFTGAETIYGVNNCIRGMHRYSGYSLLGRKQ
jgi:hypothetical protein